MRRSLLILAALLGALAILPVSGASAAFLTKRVAVSPLHNATDQTITVTYNEDDGSRTRTLAPGGTIPWMGEDALSIAMPDCGPVRLSIDNPLVGQPTAMLGEESYGDRERFSVGERRVLEWDGVRVAVERGEDGEYSNTKPFSVDVLACRPTPEPLTPVAETKPLPGFAAYVRATVHNATANPVDVLYTDANGRWRATRVDRGTTTASFGTNKSSLRLLLSDCGPANLDLSSPSPLHALFADGSAAYASLRGDWGSAGAFFDDIGERHRFDRGGNAIVVTREADTDASTQFSVDLLDCDGR